MIVTKTAMSVAIKLMSRSGKDIDRRTVLVRGAVMVRNVFVGNSKRDAPTESPPPRKSGKSECVFAHGIPQGLQTGTRTE